MRFSLPWWVRLEWRVPRVILLLCLIELPLTVAGLALYGIADPNTYRTGLWKEGANHGWNSDPIEILYAYANYKPIPVPTPWNQFITDYNVAIIVLSMFILLTKTVMYIIDIFPPVLSSIVHTVLAVLFAVSISHQAASDMSDPNHPSSVPWYLTRGCGDPVAPRNQGYCMQAKASFAVAVCLCSLFAIYLAWSIYNAIPTASQRAERPRPVDDMSSPVATYDDKKWALEMDRYPGPSRSPGPASATTMTPATPRTLAFNTLDGALGARRPNSTLPLRHHIAMGDETASGTGRFT